MLSTLNGLIRLTNQIQNRGISELSSHQWLPIGFIRYIAKHFYNGAQEQILSKKVKTRQKKTKQLYTITNTKEKMTDGLEMVELVTVSWMDDHCTH